MSWYLSAIGFLCACIRYKRERCQPHSGDSCGKKLGEFDNQKGTSRSSSPFTFFIYYLLCVVCWLIDVDRPRAKKKSKKESPTRGSNPQPCD
ncbi:hypothetical protein P170DRAFT_124532 [Aspergillus steynii IBT 23096]|uniref:Uncharacterized protein n=1 Tax=Aspergillus steynii IBT 23096 TaxID=1392250 RepID=A0A2I2GJX7_9EURO|nr:uncharacterized protein P170DRAFT_124532 [Aspergillus steynii IBT 23096]PLB53157.1 hypothetical protein P170DRAFT_124532 [Aspergillus steynii IBT 23096]